MLRAARTYGLHMHSAAQDQVVKVTPELVTNKAAQDQVVKVTPELVTNKVVKVTPELVTNKGAVAVQRASVCRRA
jgi:hypothetical protein